MNTQTEVDYWVEVEQPEGSKKLPRYQRRAILLKDGRVFLPAGIWMTESRALLGLLSDGEPFVNDSEHVYVSHVWLAKEVPKYSEDILAIGERLVFRTVETPGDSI